MKSALPFGMADIDSRLSGGALALNALHEIAGVGSRDTVPLPHGSGDQIRRGGSGPDPRELLSNGLRKRDIYIPGLHINTIKLKTGIFDSI